MGSRFVTFFEFEGATSSPSKGMWHYVPRHSMTIGSALVSWSFDGAQWWPTRTSSST